MSTTQATLWCSCLPMPTPRPPCSRTSRNWTVLRDRKMRTTRAVSSGGHTVRLIATSANSVVISPSDTVQRVEILKMFPQFLNLCGGENWMWHASHPGNITGQQQPGATTSNWFDLTHKTQGQPTIRTHDKVVEWLIRKDCFFIGRQVKATLQLFTPMPTWPSAGRLVKAQVEVPCCGHPPLEEVELLSENHGTVIWRAGVVRLQQGRSAGDD